MGNKKYCIVPRCTSTIINSPHKLFLSVPWDKATRKKWMKAMRRRTDDVSEATFCFVCEDHFNIDDDVDNILKYRLGYTKQLRLKPGVIPHIFNCQPDLSAHETLEKRRLPRKRKIKEVLEDAMQQGFSKDTLPPNTEPGVGFSIGENQNFETLVERDVKYRDVASQTEFTGQTKSTQTEYINFPICARKKPAKVRA